MSRKALLTDKAYNGSQCPACLGNDIEADHFDPEGMYQPVMCHDCGAAWKEHFTLTGFGELEDEKGNKIDLIG